jgi:NADH:ubiquinone oxidoreductase subunit 4 (subunit M)
MKVSAGYAYSDWTMRLLAPRRQAWLHIALLALSLIVLPIIPDAHWKPGAESGEPTLLILGLLGATIGIALHIGVISFFRESMPIAVDPAPEWLVVAQTTAAGFAVCCAFALVPLAERKRDGNFSTVCYTLLHTEIADPGERLRRGDLELKRPDGSASEAPLSTGLLQ